MNRIPLILSALMLIALAETSYALIMVGGKDPVSDKGWPAGSVDVANHKSRMSYFEGPPFGGGEYTFQYRGDAAVFNDVLAKFAQIRAPDLLLVIHDGPGKNNIATQEEISKGKDRTDWCFTVWTPENFYRLYANSGAFISSSQPEFRAELSPPRLDVWTGEGAMDWTAVHVPAGLRVTDERASSHGYAPEDGSVITGAAYDMLTCKPVAAVEVVLEKYNQPKPGAEPPAKAYTEVGTAVGDADGRFELKKIPAGNYRASLRCVGYATRSLGYLSVGGGAFKTYAVRMSPVVEQVRPRGRQRWQADRQGKGSRELSACH